MTGQRSHRPDACTEECVCKQPFLRWLCIITTAGWLRPLSGKQLLWWKCQQVLTVKKDTNCPGAGRNKRHNTENDYCRTQSWGAGYVSLTYVNRLCTRRRGRIMVIFWGGGVLFWGGSGVGVGYWVWGEGGVQQGKASDAEATRVQARN